MAQLILDGITHSYSNGKPSGKRKAVDDLSLEVGTGELVCLLGPSGCGKSTILRIAAGLERQDAGRVFLGETLLSDALTHQPPEARRIGLMFQDFALFPHLRARGNVRFGIRGKTREDASRLADAYLARVGLADFAAKYPHELSGGEQQRVALARALAARSRVMLMDEPFSGLDNRLRDAVRDDALSLLKSDRIGVLMVTHDPEEALRMADRIALMREGRIVQIGAPYHIYHHPRDLGAAAFFSDLNVIEARVRAGQTDTPFGRFLAPGLSDGTDVQIAVRPQHLHLALDDGRTVPKADAARGAPARGRVMRARFMGAQCLIDVEMAHDGSVLRAMTDEAFLPEPGRPLWLSLRRDRCFVFPLSSRTQRQEKAQDVQERQNGKALRP